MKMEIKLDDGDFFARVRRVIMGVSRETQATNRAFAARMLQTIRRNASGHPGPMVQTGQYVGAFRSGFGDRGYEVWVENDSPQTQRLEYGFVGVDSLGRHYSQPPFPHFRPTYDQIAPEYVRALGKTVEDLIDG